MKTNYLNPRRMLTCLALLSAQLALVSTCAAAGTNEKGQLSSDDYKFATAAACGGMTEVNLGNLAAQRSTNASVQQFGRRMVTDHGKAGQDLQQITTRKGASLPAEPTSAQQKEIDKLTKLSGADFDKAYIKLMVEYHKSDEKAFKKAAEDVQDPDLKAFAASTLTMVQDHLKMAEDMDQSLKHNTLSMNQ